MVPWTFFTSSLTSGIPSLTGNMNLVTKIYFPREILPLAGIGAAFVDFLLSVLVLIGLMLFYRSVPGILALWVVPLLSLQVILSIGVVLLGSTIIVFFRDMRFVLPLLITIWMYACPIVYPASNVPEEWQTLYFLNPMAGIIESYRDILLEQSFPGTYIFSAGFISLLIAVIGYWFFKRVEYLFADIV